MKSANKQSNSHHKLYLGLLVIIMVVASFVRLWRIPETLQFLGDQGRDAIIVSRIFKEADLVFIGPVTSVGNMYLGPLYYYFMLPFLWLSYPSPLGPVYAVACLGILTVFLMYALGKRMLNREVALLAAALMAISKTVATNTRFSWNPNPAPLVSLVMMYGTYLAWKKHPKYWLLVALCFSILIQLHYLTLLSITGAGLIWLFSIVEARKISKQLIFATVGAAVIVLMSLTPLVLFDYKHAWLNAKGLQNMVVGEDNFIREDTNLTAKIAKTVKETHGRGMHILFEITVGKQRQFNTFLLFTTAILLITSLYPTVTNSQYRDKNTGLIVVSTYLITGILGTSLYEHSVFDHYIAYLFPASFFIIAWALHKIWRFHHLGKVLSVGFVLVYLGYNLQNLPFKPGGWQISDIKRTSQTIADRVQPGDKYNLVLLSETGDIDAQNYRYFLETTDTPPLKVEQRGETEILFVINEDQEIENVADSPIYEIVVFPNKATKEVYTIPDGPEITIFRVEETPSPTESTETQE